MKLSFQAAILASAVTLGGGLLTAAEIEVPTAEKIREVLQSRPEQDEIRWKDPARGAPLKVRIVSADDKSIRVDKTLTAGLTSRTVPLTDLAGATFTLTPGEISLHRHPQPAAVPALEILWSARKTTLSLTGSNAADTGLALAKSLRLSDDPPALDTASDILAAIRASEAPDHKKSTARFEQETIDLIRLIRSGKENEADEFAWKICEKDDNRDAMLIATSYLCDRHFQQLKSLEEDNPRWTEDDEVRPVRERIYHLVLDLALYPSLFAGTREPEASAGLAKAAEIHRHTSRPLLEKGTLEDLAALYPSSEAAEKTAAHLTRLREMETSGNLTSPEPEPKPESETDPAPEDEPTDSKPAPPKRYSIFGD